MHALMIVLIIMSIFGPAGATSSVAPKAPSLEDYLERRLPDCVNYSGLGIDECESQIKKFYRSKPFQQPLGFLHRLAGQKSLLKNVSVVTEDQLQKLIQEIKTLPLSLHDEINGCSQRAELISYFLASRHQIKTGQIYARGSIRILSAHIPLVDASIRWSYHIAPFILVKINSGTVQPYSLDLTLLAGEARPLVQWLQALQKNSPELLEYHALHGFQTNPLEPGDTPVLSWQDRATDLLEEQLRAKKPLVIHRESPRSPELASHFIQSLQTKLWVVKNPFAEMQDSTPQPWEQWMSAPQRQAIQNQLHQDLRCESGANSERLCSVHFFNQQQDGFCEARLYIQSKTERVPEVYCYPFAN